MTRATRGHTGRELSADGATSLIYLLVSLAAITRVAAAFAAAWMMPLLILHVGYAWLVLGAGLLGLSMLDTHLPQSAAIHALTAGATGTMILAVMTRATRGHTGRALSADRATSLIYLLVSLAAITRVVAACATAWMMPLLILSGGLWIAAFVGFVLRYGPMLLGSRPAR